MTPHRKLTALLLSIVGSLPLQSILWAQVPPTPPGTEKEATSLKTRSQAGAVQAPVSEPSSSAVTPGNAIPAGRILRVALDRPLLKLSKLQSGSELDGQVMRPVYLGDRVLIPQGASSIWSLTGPRSKNFRPSGQPVFSIVLNGSAVSGSGHRQPIRCS